MAEVHVIAITKFNLYIKCIGDNLSLSFVDNPYDALYFTKEVADEVVRLLNVNTPYFLTVQPINEEEDIQEES